MRPFSSRVLRLAASPCAVALVLALAASANA